MSRKRKRGTGNDVGVVQNHKKARREILNFQVGTLHHSGDLQHPVLSCYFPRVVTLRAFLLSEIHNSRHKRLAKINHGCGTRGVQNNFLDSTVVGVAKETNVQTEMVRNKEFYAFTQDPQRTSDGVDGSTSEHDIADIVDFAISSLFKTNSTSFRPKHVLCHGYQSAISRGIDRTPADAPKIPGLILEQPNDNVQALKQEPWPNILTSLGKGGDRVILRLLLDCAIFLRLSSGKDNYYQLSGTPVSDLPALTAFAGTTSRENQAQGYKRVLKPNDIVFARHRILYAKPALNSKGNVHFGMRHSHVLNHYQNVQDTKKIKQVMEHVFPRQFGLQNVFNSGFDQQPAAKGVKSYAVREAGVCRRTKKSNNTTDDLPNISSLPRRLRGAARVLVRKMQRNHTRCPYAQLLRHYTSPAVIVASKFKEIMPTQPLQSCTMKTQVTASLPPNTMTTTSSIRESAETSRGSVMQYATPSPQISAFCQAVVQRLLPHDAFGTGLDGDANREIILRWVDHFIAMRRNETLNLHVVLQGIKISAIDWLKLPKLANLGMSASDRDKRWEIFREFAYFIFDSLLIPLIRSNFYVTESAVHRSRLFYFRHDVWRKISEPSLSQVKLTMFEEVALETTMQTLGHSTIRLLPKLNGIRIIANLKKKVIKNFRGKLVLSNGINKQIEPVFDVLTYERSQQPLRLGSSIFSSNEIHGGLKEFKNRIGKQELYFVKLDIKSCFDSIPQDELVKLTETLLRENQYRVHTRGEIKAGDDSKMSRKFPHMVLPADDNAPFSARVAANLAIDRKRTVFVDTGNLKVQKIQPLLKLLREHITSNTVRIGKKQYRQKSGIPQGSILSSLLCSFFYGAFEAENLSFLDDRSLLVRLIDDFLLITTEPAAARRFLDVMASGNPKYGITVQPSKSLTNFDATVNGKKIPRLHGTTAFPYIGLTIDTSTLSVTKERVSKDPDVRNGLTVQVKQAGRAFRTKVLHSLKIQMLAMVFDTGLNGKVKVLASLYQCFVEMAMKMCNYIHALGTTPSSVLVVKVLEESISLAFNLMRQQSRVRTKVGYQCDLNKIQIEWVASNAIDCVLRKKQSRYGEVLIWASRLKNMTQPGIKIDKKTQALIVEEGSRDFRGYVY